MNLEHIKKMCIRDRLKEKSSDSINNNLVAAYVSLGEENLKAQNLSLIHISLSPL